jgi:hypothetical protein
MISNSHRDVYKRIKKNNKLLSNTIINKDSKEYKICLDLINLKYIKLLSENTYNATFNVNEDVSMIRKKREKAYQYILIDKERFPIKLSEKPLFGGKGRTWDTITHIVNEQEIPMYLDTTWGNYIYFQTTDERWYKIGSNSKYVFEDDYGYIGFNKLLTDKKLNIKLHF